MKIASRTGAGLFGSRYRTVRNVINRNTTRKGKGLKETNESDEPREFEGRAVIRPS